MSIMAAFVVRIRRKPRRIGQPFRYPPDSREVRLSNAKRAPTSIIVTNKSAGMVKSYPAIIRAKMGNRAVAKITVTRETKPDLKPAPAKLVPKVIIVGARTQIPRSTEVARGCLPSPWWRRKNQNRSIGQHRKQRHCDCHFPNGRADKFRLP